MWNRCSCSLLNQITLSSQGPELEGGSLEDRRMKQKLIRPNKKRAASYLLIFWNFQTKGILTSGQSFLIMMYALKNKKTKKKLFCISVLSVFWCPEYGEFFISPMTHLLLDFIFLQSFILKRNKSSRRKKTEMNHNSRIVFSGAGKLYFIKWILIRTEMKHRFPGNILITSWYKCFKAAGK